MIGRASVAFRVAVGVGVGALLALAPPAQADGARDAAFAPGPCPALLLRVRQWVARLGTDLPPDVRAATKARLVRVCRDAAPELAAGLVAARTALDAAPREAEAPARRVAVSWVLDLLEILGASESAHAFDPLARAAEDAGLTNTLRHRAIHALGVLGDPRAVAVLARLRTEPALDLYASKALLAIARFESVPQWIALVDHGVQEVSGQALQQLRQRSGEQLPRESAAWARYFREFPEGFKSLPGYVER